MSVLFRQFDHIITEQYQAEQAWLAEYHKGKYTFDNPYVKLNPYLVAPLTALVMFKTAEPTSVAVTVKGKEKAGDISFKFPEATEHMIPIYGLYADYANQVELVLGNGEKNLLIIQTEAAPDKLKLPTKVTTTAEYFEDNIMFVTPTSEAFTAGYDYLGDARWYNTLNLCWDLMRLENGRLLVGDNRLVAPPYHVTGTYEMGMIGKIYKEYRLPSGYHHDAFEMEDGNLLMLTQDLPRGTVEDMLALVDRKTGQILKTWDYQKVLPQDVGGSGSQDAHDWFHNNAVWYDKKTNSLTLSGRHQDIIINIDYETGALNWVIGDPEGWPQELVNKYFFKPAGEGDFDWQYEQHACVVLPDGDIMALDNGHWRAKVKERYIPAKENFTRGVRYRIDTDKMEIEQVWQYGKERGAEFYSCYISNVEYYSEGHYLVHSGGIGTLNGEALDKPPVGVRGEDKENVVFNSITVELKDDVVMYEMQLPANYYRAEKLKLYCHEDVLTLGKGELLGTLGVTEEFTTIPPTEEGGIVPEKYNVKLGLEEDRLIFKATFEKGQMVLLQLEGETTHSYYVPTTKRPFMAMCVGTFQESDERAVEFPISAEGLAGEFKISLIVDEYKYETGVIVEF
ncbi:Arylsulfotransferase (ASST) [Desulfosporosinus orientis DSM 765]|uniref:Arylsulfotransferase (ASST) n=1 Tax=Desulfosporosinus orientis (strain ATCC 19365 / DSM 765 / NCIMB 8382 / VKM B-1628 / Singapore I) TaxID=768706 RepID=G7WJ50_DESOD|nr:aryl-sulfate sulfotransferase [Desulfosporosinus orientis]AET70362.1 Arylsulfotransferase (ASST) [Desulfosporosinus orientis DSM 765]